MARLRKSGDTSYNARRREYRAAQRYLKKAESTSGATSEKNRALAYIHLQNAISTYDPTQTQRISAPIAKMAAQFGMTESDIRQQYQTTSDKQRRKAIKESETALSKVPADVLREREAQAIMNNPTISKRILGGLVEVWSDKVKSGVSAQENRTAIDKAVFEYFNADSWADVLAALEENSIDYLFAPDMGDDIYDAVKLSIQLTIAGKSIAA